ncbi:MAG: hypothetical protein KC488_03925, partial [Candidatus Cloacimonetes bacterium]|nr:hypothetical protein [Candidatus Cloacimonadota bacterium]
PTGTISNIVLSFRAGKKNYIGVSGGVEPVFATHYTRRTESLDNQKFKVFHSTISAWIDMMGKNEEVARADKLEQVLPAFFFRTAHHVDPTRRVRIQSVIQRYIDHSISSTLNLPEDVQPEVISDIYLDAWRMGLKGVTVYRDGSRVPILSLDGKPTEFQRFRQRQFRLRVGDSEQLVAGDEILRLPDGTKFTLMAPVIENRKGEHRDVLDELRAGGFARARIDGVPVRLDEDIKLEKNKKHTIEVVV